MRVKYTHVVIMALKRQMMQITPQRATDETRAKPRDGP